jgi:hypothetical protein
MAVYTPIGTESIYDDILPTDFSLLLQQGVGFGERLFFAAEDLFRCRFDSVCSLIPTAQACLLRTFRQPSSF